MLYTYVISNNSNYSDPSNESNEYSPSSNTHLLETLDRCDPSYPLEQSSGQFPIRRGILLY